jgi:hypothetical protein
MHSCMAANTPTVEEIETAQSRHHYQTLKEQMAKRDKRLKDESVREKNKRVQKEKDLAEAEEQIEQLRKDLSFLEEALESGSKRSVPTRSPRDSPVSPDTKRTKMEEPIQSFQTSAKQGRITFAGSNPILSPLQDQTLQNQTLQNQTLQDQTLQDQTLQNKIIQESGGQTQSRKSGDQTQGGQTQSAQGGMEEISQTTIMEGTVAECIQSPNTQTEESEESQSSKPNHTKGKARRRSDYSPSNQRNRKHSKPNHTYHNKISNRMDA